MNILVTGATGFLGSRIVEHLLGEDKINHIIATGRKISVDTQISHQKLHYILGDLRDKYFINSLFEKSIDIIINCAISYK